MPATRAADEGRWLGLLHGMPIALKDNIETAGVRTTSGAAYLADHIPNSDAPVVGRLKAQGAVLIGKANMQELAWGVVSTNPVVGQCRNPWNPERIPGGSSGGSGAVVAAEMAAAALGTDTGGSVRIPASMTGVAGLRPTHGRISIRGITPVSVAHDTVGPMARSVADVARLFAALAAYDPLDPVSRDLPLGNFLPRLDDGIEGCAHRTRAQLLLRGIGRRSRSRSARRRRHAGIAGGRAVGCYLAGCRDRPALDDDHGLRRCLRLPQGAARCRPRRALRGGLQAG